MFHDFLSDEVQKLTQLPEVLQCLNCLQYNGDSVWLPIAHFLKFPTFSTDIIKAIFKKRIFARRWRVGFYGPEARVQMTVLRLLLTLNFNPLAPVECEKNAPDQTVVLEYYLLRFAC